MNQLVKTYGKGFSRSNLLYMRKLYTSFPISGTLSHLLRSIQNNVLLSKYQMYLPKKEELQQELERLFIKNE